MNSIWKFLANSPFVGFVSSTLLSSMFDYTSVKKKYRLNNILAALFKRQLQP